VIRRRAVNRDIDNDLLFAAESTGSDLDDFADDTYSEPEDHAFEAVGGVHDDHVEREVRHILARVFGM
jgi:hypothetical protein